MPATAHLNIAITDKNPHVREFLCRELAGLGHTACVLPSPGALLETLCGPRLPQVLVLDPEAAGTSLAEVARRLKSCAGQVVVVLHVFEGAEPEQDFADALVVEKQPDMRALKMALAALAEQLARLSAAEGRE